MNSFDAFARAHSELNEGDLLHLQKLIQSWGMLSDLCLADLLLFVPVAESEGSKFVVLGQARPTTSQTFHLDVLVGRLFDEAERPMITKSWQTGNVVIDEDFLLGRGERARVEAIPVRRGTKIVGILSREGPIAAGRRPGQLERVYIETFNRLARMVSSGIFPFEVDIWDKSSPRIGDGSLLLDKDRRIVFASPNAMNAMHRMGFLSNVLGSRFEEIGISGSLVRRTFETGQPTADELEPRLNINLAIACLPLIVDDEVDGALIMIRDVTDLRRLDRLLLSKDATIREIHHRVKNNLQTITSLLDLQSRRLEVGPARTALEDAHRRVRSIALVHEILSRDANDQVPFNDIIEPLVRVASHTAPATDHRIEFEIVGDAGELEASVATPLAVVIAELLANAVEHAFAGEFPAGERSPKVTVSLENDRHILQVQIRDNGNGLPPGFSIHRTKSLGLSIVRSLVTSQLQGSIEMHSLEGTVVDLSVPLHCVE